MYIYIHIHTYNVYIYIHVYMYTYIYIHMLMCIYIYVSIIFSAMMKSGTADRQVRRMSSMYKQNLVELRRVNEPKKSLRLSLRIPPGVACISHIREPSREKYVETPERTNKLQAPTRHSNLLEKGISVSTCLFA